MVAEQAPTRQVPFAVTVGATYSLDDKLAIERQLAQFVLSEAEAAFSRPVRHFFIPGGQQLQYNHN